MPTTFHKHRSHIVSMLFLLLLIVFDGCRNAHNQNDLKKTYKESLISSKWKLREVDSGIEYFIEFRDSLYIAQYYREQEKFPKMYPGEWSINGDTLFINDKRGNFSSLFLTLNDSVMILQRTDSVVIIFDRLSDDFKIL